MPSTILRKRTRHLVVFFHVIVSLGWMGAGLANIVLAMTAAYGGRGPAAVRAAYDFMWQLELFLIIPGAFLALGTGVLLSLTTRWGLVQHWWVLVKLVLTVGVILFSTFFVGVWVEKSIQATAAGAVSSAHAYVLAWWPFLNVAAFLVMTWASIDKPWGRTPWVKRTRRRRRPRPAVSGVRMRETPSGNAADHVPIAP